MSHRIDKAMVMAAGMGTRMRPLTDDRPKPLVKVAGRALLDHVLDRLDQAGVKTAVVNLHYKADMIEAHLKERTSPKILFSDERDQLLDTGGGMKKALPLLDDGPFFVANSDALWVEGLGANLENMRSAWDDDHMDALLLCAPTVSSVGSIGRGDFNMDSIGRLSRRQSSSVAPFMMAGVQIIHPRLLNEAPSGPFSTNLLWNKAIETGRLFGMRIDGIWLHASSTDDIDEIERTLGQL
jgi:MurNAc alpha-1-phosphate uridylyltransferase